VLIIFEMDGVQIYQATRTGRRPVSRRHFLRPKSVANHEMHEMLTGTYPDGTQRLLTFMIPVGSRPSVAIACAFEVETSMGVPVSLM
jgi:hypothetical protein